MDSFEREWNRRFKKKCFLAEEAALKFVFVASSPRSPTFLLSRLPPTSSFRPLAVLTLPISSLLLLLRTPLPPPCVKLLTPLPKTLLKPSPAPFSPDLSPSPAGLSCINWYQSGSILPFPALLCLLGRRAAPQQGGRPPRASFLLPAAPRRCSPASRSGSTLSLSPSLSLWRDAFHSRTPHLSSRVRRSQRRSTSPEPPRGPRLPVRVPCAPFAAGLTGSRAVLPALTSPRSARLPLDPWDLAIRSDPGSDRAWSIPIPIPILPSMPARAWPATNGA
ncbi:hypothetical protein Taro_025908 [Colocasia esculenta]|uniref:Uncharacterized protein n=1 Tax=Colocasia esculenta TaxID=4460 RepID=A0A843VDK9_COLES|nr:hypothetical protein [Colocasia esculenta]